MPIVIVFVVIFYPYDVTLISAVVIMLVLIFITDQSIA